jgi:hypothetical protein
MGPSNGRRSHGLVSKSARCDSRPYNCQIWLGIDRVQPTVTVLTRVLAPYCSELGMGWDGMGCMGWPGSFPRIAIARSRSIYSHCPFLVYNLWRDHRHPFSSSNQSSASTTCLPQRQFSVGITGQLCRSFAFLNCFPNINGSFMSSKPNAAKWLPLAEGTFSPVTRISILKDEQAT